MLNHTFSLLDQFSRKTQNRQQSDSQAYPTHKRKADLTAWPYISLSVLLRIKSHSRNLQWPPQRPQQDSHPQHLLLILIILSFYSLACFLKGPCGHMGVWLRECCITFWCAVVKSPLLIWLAHFKAFSEPQRRGQTRPWWGHGKSKQFLKVNSVWK